MDRLRLVAEPRRQEILRLVWNEPMAVTDIAACVDVTIAAVSQHLGKLHAAGLVTVRRDGRRHLYAADQDALAELGPLLTAMWAADLDSLASRAEASEAQPHRER